MSSTEDYLDSLLNSIDKAKTDIDSNINAKHIEQQEAIVERNKISANDDFIKASGIDGYASSINSSRPHLRKMFTESEFLREFENELEIDSVDSFIEDFEREIDDEEKYFEQTGEVSPAEATVAALLDGVEQEVKEVTEKVAAKLDEPMNLSTDNIYVDNIGDIGIETSETSEEPEDDSDIDITSMLEGVDFSEEADDEGSMPSDDASGSEDDDPDGLGIGLDEEEIISSDDEYQEDSDEDLDSDDEPDLSLGLDAPIESEGGLDIESLLDENGNILEGFEDISGLDGFEELEEGAEASEGGEASSADDAEDSKGKKKKKEKKPNPLMDKIKLILFGEPEEGDDEPIFGKKKPKDGEEGEEKPKKEKKPKEPKPKKEKKEKPPKPPKPPKPKKEKKPKEPDRSPKIPLKLIIMNVIMAVMMVVFVCLVTVLLGKTYHMSKAEDAFDSGDYIEAFASLDGYELKDEDDILFKEKTRILADMQETKKLYDSFMRLGQYQFALDELIKGVGRHKENASEAAGYGISTMYDELYADIAYQLDVQFHVSEDKALQVYNSNNRRLYTIEIYKILKDNGINYENLRWNK